MQNLKLNHDSWVRLLSEKELRRWGAFHSRVFDSRPRCNLGPVIELGINVPSGYGQVSYYYPDILQTQRVWAMMPDSQMRVVYLHYCYGGTKTRKAFLLGMTRNTFNYHLGNGFDFYCRYRDADFSEFGYTFTEV